ncbi:transposase [Nocardia sp. NPDC052278]|uniref:transposase n=1 Tax=unclassified Nocardia TaxID=2637762 RepID=UPI0036B59464
MAKSYRPVLRDQPMLLPIDMREWLPSDHLVWFVLDCVEVLDTAMLEQVTRRRGGAGAAGFDPRMLLALTVYAYCQGVRSSRQIERMCATDVAFRVLCAQDGPDHTTIARFRRQARDVFSDLFSQVLMFAAEAGMCRFGTVAIDGTKIAANASIDANRGQEWFDRHVHQMLDEAESIDNAEDAAARVTGNRTDRVPADLADRHRRVERIRAAAQQLREQQQRRDRVDEEREAVAVARRRRSEAGLPVVGRIPDGPHRLPEARAHLDREIAIHQAKLDRYSGLIAAGKKPMGRPPVPMDSSTRVLRARRVVHRAEQAAAAAGEPKVKDTVGLPKVVANTTDPQSRIMPTRKGYLQGYNAHVAVTGDQFIVAVSVGQSTNDQACFLPMMRAAQVIATRLHEVTGNPEHVIGTVLADAGYNSETNLNADGPDRLIALGKARDQARTQAEEPTAGPPPANASRREHNRHRLRTPEGRQLYRRRGATVEPGIGNLKKIIDRFSCRGLDNATSELHLAATAFNLMKIYRATATA